MVYLLTDMSVITTTTNVCLLGSCCERHLESKFSRSVIIIIVCQWTFEKPETESLNVLAIRRYFFLSYL